MNVNVGNPSWHPAKRILFRFAFAYLALYSICAFGGGISLCEDLWNAVVPWVGQHVFGVSLTARPPTPRGDLTFDYVRLFCFAALATAATAVWSLLDWKRSHYMRLSEWLRVGVRFVLAWQMILYGAAKVIPTQMPSPSLAQLLQPFGDSSRMGLLWTFMGASAGYMVFTGAAEMLGGLLLTTRRTTLLGALVCVGVMSNVVMLNFGYDVCVKIHSSHLLAMAVFLILPDLRRLANLFLLGRRGETVPARPFFARVWLNQTALVLRTVLVLYVTYTALSEVYEVRKTMGDGAPKPPLYGIWNVEEFAIDGEVRPPLLTDTTRWRRAIVENVFGQPTLGIQLMNDAGQYYALQSEPETNRMALAKFEDPAWQTTISYQEREPGLLTLEGTFDGRKVRATLRRVDESRFALNRGFHWISE